MKPGRCATVGYMLAGMRFNSISMCHMLDTFHVCYQVTSVNTAEPRSTMRDGDQQNTGKSVDHGSVMERSVAGAGERSGIKKNKGKMAISSQPRGKTVIDSMRTWPKLMISTSDQEMMISTWKLNIMKGILMLHTTMIQCRRG